MQTLQTELSKALTDQDSLLSWFNKRGWSPASKQSLIQDHKLLEGGLLLDSLEHPDAPIIHFLWNGKLGSATKGKRLREIQRAANEQQNILVSKGLERQAPHLFALACDDFLIFFPLDGDTFARRLRFTPDRLQREESPLGKHFGMLRTSTMAQWIIGGDDPEKEGEGDSDDGSDDTFDFLDETEEGIRSFDFSAKGHLFVGDQLDNDFVAFMGQTRRRFIEKMLDPKARGKVLIPILKAIGFSKSTGEGVAPDGFPTLVWIARSGRDRRHLIAVADTVLLRFVLYRYLETQYDYKASEEEKRGIAFGSYDDLLKRTTKVDSKAMEELMEKARKPKQLDLFASSPPPVRVTDSKGFQQGVQERQEYYQGAAGGDLHQGQVAEAADLLGHFIQTEHEELIAVFLEGTRANRYSFDYADLDPRAFQRFYENTIGTDLRLDPEGGKLRVETWHRNRKEQGAYFTDERFCRWLVGETLGRRFDIWKSTFLTLLSKQAKRGRLPKLRKQLDELLNWKVLDPTCGGGIFLRSAFEFLSQHRGVIADALKVYLPAEELRTLTEKPSYRYFRDESEHGEWEWYILLNMLYGVDIDVKAINIASNLLTLSSLVYKPNGVCFPSFINTNLKQGNALVVPLRPEQREQLPKRYGKKIRKLLDLRTQLRSPDLSRDEWRTLHKQTAKLTAGVVNTQIVECFKDLFPKEKTHEALIERVQRVGVFLYELEFPEVFFQPKGKGGVEWRSNPGFDVIVGNPPWEVPAQEYKKFLPEFDPEYLELSGRASKAREKKWMAVPEVKQRWEAFGESIKDYRTLLTSTGWYRHQKSTLRGKSLGISTNLYRYATEQTYHLLNNDGFGGLVLDGGLWSDLSSKSLRMLLLDQCQVLAVCGFTNSKGIFPDVHRSYKFACTVFQKGERTEQLPIIFMRESLEDLENFSALSLELPVKRIRESPQDTYPVSEIRSVEHWRASLALESHLALMQNPWRIDTLGEEFHAGRQREFFIEQQEGFYPLIQGTQFNLFGVQQGALPEAWIDPQAGGGAFIRKRQEGRILKGIANCLKQSQGKMKGGKKAAALAWVKALTGKDSLPDEWVKLDWDGYRLAWRDICRNDDRRTLIAAILPRRVGVTDTAPFVRPYSWKVHSEGIRWELQYPLPHLLYLAGVLSSFSCDSLARTRISKTHLKSGPFKNFNVPIWKETPAQVRVAELTARLTCLPVTLERPWADYGELAGAVGLVPGRDGLVDGLERREAEVELNALVAGLYGLGRTEFRFLMDTLFMTPKYKETHSELRDAIAGRLEE